MIPVCMVAYYGAKYLSEWVDSILMQQLSETN